MYHCEVITGHVFDDGPTKTGTKVLCKLLSVDFKE
jgi:peptide methionine sulfoxide reductase MsrB